MNGRFHQDRFQHDERTSAQSPQVPQGTRREAVASIDERFRARIRMLQSIDEALGSIRALLEQRGLLASTYIVFSSDHGWHQGEHNQHPGKGRPHDEDIRVPLIVAGPGIPAGRTIDRLVGNAGWGDICARMEAHFRAGRFVDGVLGGIDEINALLAAHFPPAEDDRDELPNRPRVLG